MTNAAMLIGMDIDELKSALGGIVLESAHLERVLRAAFSALVASKYAAVFDGRMTAHTLIEDCHHVTRVHTGLPAPARAELVAALNACDAVNRQRNRVIHDSWAYRPDNALVTLQSDRDSQDVTVITRSLADLASLADQIAAAAARLTAAVTGALGADSLRTEDQLRLELGHDVGADFG
jgi:hypothetical protein